MNIKSYLKKITPEFLKRSLRMTRQLGLEFLEAWRYMQEERSFSSPFLDYEAYWQFREVSSNSVEPHFPWNLRQMLAELMDPGATVLDIGCGNGNALKYWMEVKGVRGTGIDIAPNAVESTRAKGIAAQVADITDPEFQVREIYDYIVLSEVLEHLANPELVILKLKDAFCKALLVTIPNTGYYQHRLRLLLGHFPIQWAWHPGEHLRFWTIPDFERWATDLGFAVTGIYPGNGFPILYRVMPNLFCRHVIFALGANNR
jgi:methionine biosynthesis protein MetW